MEDIGASQAPFKEFEIIEGVRENSQLLYVFAEKKLYVRKVTRNGATEFICYGTIVGKIEEKNHHIRKCTARVKLLPNDTLKKMCVQHSCSIDHDIIRRDLDRRTNMKNKCKSLKKDFPEESYKFSPRFIFQRETLRYTVFFLTFSKNLK